MTNEIMKNDPFDVLQQLHHTVFPDTVLPNPERPDPFLGSTALSSTEMNQYKRMEHWVQDPPSNEATIPRNWTEGLLYA